MLSSNDHLKEKYTFTLLMVIYFFAGSIYTPAMPEIAHYFSASNSSIKSTMTYFQLGTLSACLMTGLYADSIGKVTSLLLALGIGIAGSLLCWFAFNIEAIMVGRFLQGIGSTAGFVIGFALVLDLFGKTEAIKVFGFMGAFSSFAVVFSPTVGGLISTYFGWKYLFSVIFVVFCTALFFSHFSLNTEDLNKKKKSSYKEILSTYKLIAMNRKILTYGLLNPIFLCGFWYFMTILPLYFQNELGLSAFNYGLILGAALIPFPLGTIAGGKLPARYGADIVIYCGLALSLIGCLYLIAVSVFIPKDILQISIGIAAYIGGLGLLWPASAAVTVGVFPVLSTKVSSIRLLMVTLFSYLGSILAQTLDHRNIMNLSLVLLSVSLVSLLIFFIREKDDI